MYKYIWLAALMIVLSKQALATEWTAENCTNRGGTIVTMSNGTKLCRTTKPMNWWSANSWCQKHGGKLASIASVCASETPTLQGQCASGGVSTIGNHVWTSTTAGAPDGYAWLICQADDICTTWNMSKTKTSVPIYTLCE